MPGCSLAGWSMQVWDQSRTIGHKKEGADHTSGGVPLWFYHHTKQLKTFLANVAWRDAECLSGTLLPCVNKEVK